MVTRGNDLSFRPGQPAYRGAVLGAGGVAVQSGPGFVPVVLPGRRQSVPLTGPARGVGPVPGGRGASRWVLPAGSAGCLPPPRVRGGRIKVIVAWRRARRLGRLCRRHQPPPGDADQVPRCPGLAPASCPPRSQPQKGSSWCSQTADLGPKRDLAVETIGGPAEWLTV
jgi:hypothetical protein